jgi:hypothetical protein
VTKLFKDALERFEDNLTILEEKRKHDGTENDLLIWNLSVGLRNLTDALSAAHESTQSTLQEIKTSLQRHG